MKSEDRIGQKFGHWTIIGIGFIDKGKDRKFECKYSCGDVHFVKAGNLREGKTKQCNKCSQIKYGESRKRLAKARHKALGHVFKSGKYYDRCKCGNLMDKTATRCISCTLKYPVRLKVLAAQFGITKYAVRYQIRTKGYKKAIKYLEQRK